MCVDGCEGGKKNYGGRGDRVSERRVHCCERERWINGGDVGTRKSQHVRSNSGRDDSTVFTSSTSQINAMTWIRKKRMGTRFGRRGG